ncbi:uncharacterized protein EV422DRAFT_530640 [Fimicolochytrium jonesii]|uniref:uncharacterized protein n=1 Tax=Fimicolochytrium jonesii TaxID=1396493 RepID=UPI0022FDF29F|nr:uncharacterized protein EV422DRAFT_530640 [Fimicolochytrium jonesii]KAI8820370.1 hypothetical protein EV422DRAFT_530640 [Fimicolochytrium jonesii]
MPAAFSNTNTNTGSSCSVPAEGNAVIGKDGLPLRNGVTDSLAEDCAQKSGTTPKCCNKEPSVESTLGAIFSVVLGSSCCIIPLTLDMASVSFSGLGYLTAYQPLFRAITIIILVSNVWRYGTTRRTILTIAFCLLVSFGPQLLSASTTLSNGSRSAEVDPPASAPAPPISPFEKERLCFRVDGMRCGSCAARIEKAVVGSTFSEVDSATVDLGARTLVATMRKPRVGDLDHAQRLFHEEGIKRLVQGLDSAYKVEYVKDCEFEKRS